MQAQSTPQRKYALSRVRAGDYLLPSNDGQTIWRLTTYTERADEIEGLERDYEGWCVWRWTERVAEGGYVDVEDWSRWEFCEGWCDTRKDAINAAMRISA